MKMEHICTITKFISKNRHETNVCSETARKRFIVNNEPKYFT